MQTPHLHEDAIERYAMGKLIGDELDLAEEHLLICQQCRNDVELIVLIVAGIREDLVRHGK